MPLKFYDGHKPGEIVSRATNDLDKMSEVLQRGVLTLLTAIGSIIGSVIMMLTYSVELTVIFLVFSAISLALPLGFPRQLLALRRGDRSFGNLDWGS